MSPKRGGRATIFDYPRMSRNGPQPDASDCVRECHMGKAFRVGTLPQTSFDLRQRAPQLAFEHRSVRHRSLLQMRLQAGKAEKQSDAQRHP